MRKTVVTKNLKCTKCYSIMPIPRKANRNRKAGHIKTMWCVNCKKRVRHVELSTFEA